MPNLWNPLANWVTVSRIAAAITMLFVTPFSAVSWVLYCFCGISDVADGIFARRLHQESEFGAKLDSIADAVFYLSSAVIFASVIPIPVWLWLCIACALLLRLVSYGVGFVKYRGFFSVHTYANKAAGVLLFLSPLLFCLFGLTVTEIIVSAAVILSAAEELAVTVSHAEPQRNRKSLLR